MRIRWPGPADHLPPFVDSASHDTYGTNVKAGILSDSHGSVSRTRHAARLLNREDVDVVVHCGDIGSEAVLLELIDAFGARPIPVYAVLGNVDLYNEQLEAFPENAGVTLCGRFAELELADKRVAVVHGDDTRKLQAAVSSAKYDVVLTGHTHVCEETIRDGVRIVNPGAVYRSPNPTVAVWDLDRDKVTFLPLTE